MATLADMRFVCPKDVKKMLVQRARSVYWKKWASKHGYEEFERGNVAGKRASSLAKEGEGTLDRKSIVMWPGRSFWKEVGREKDCSISIGRTPANVKPAKKRGRDRKAQAIPLPRMVRGQTRDS